MNKETKYMNSNTGSVDTYDGWWYEDENGIEVNAVDRGEVVEIPTYVLINERYGNERQEVTIDELRTLLRDVFADTETELEERADGIYEVESGELVAESA